MGFATVTEDLRNSMILNTCACEAQTSVLSRSRVHPTVSILMKESLCVESNHINCTTADSDLICTRVLESMLDIQPIVHALLKINGHDR